MKPITISKFVVRVSMIMSITGALFSCQSTEKVKADSLPLSKTAKMNTQMDSTSPISQSKADTTNKDVQSKQEQRKLVVYYLHGTFRCQSCNTIERLTKEAVERGFADQIKNGRMEIKIINIEEPGNKHYIEDYKLYTKSVILSDLKNGKETTWKNLDQVWTLLGNESKFIEYIQREITSYLKG